MKDQLPTEIKDKNNETAPENGKILHEFDMSRSRRFNSRKSKATKSFLFYLIASVVAILIIGFAGFQLLINYSLLLDKIRGDDSKTTTDKKDEVFLNPPSFGIPYTATNSSSLNFSGKTNGDVEIELFINDKIVDSTNADKNSFKFKNIKLNEGENAIKVRAKKDNVKSSFSETKIISYRKSEPKLEVSNPNNGDSFSGGQSILKVKGKTESYAKVTINGAWAIMDDEGNFSYDYQMQNGDNTLNIVSKDDAENKVEKEIKFTYSP